MCGVQWQFSDGWTRKKQQSKFNELFCLPSFCPCCPAAKKGLKDDDGGDDDDDEEKDGWLKGRYYDVIGTEKVSN